jgi:hypothetical protein
MEHSKLGQFLKDNDGGFPESRLSFQYPQWNHLPRRSFLAQWSFNKTQDWQFH